MDSNIYKQLHEDYIKDNNGTTSTEIFITILPTFYTTFLYIYLIYFLIRISSNSIIQCFIAEFTVIILPLVLSLTVLNPYILEVNVTITMLCIMFYFQKIYNKRNLAAFVKISCKKPGYINCSRAVINLLTGFCILAVDFKVFPKKLAKTETFGFGLMDIGVGLFVFSNGIVANEERNLNKAKTVVLRDSILQNLPLVLLGAVRWFSIQKIDYQQHITEYGVHWNFFITLALTKIIGSFIASLFRSNQHLKYAGLLIATSHEFFLQIGLARYVLQTTDRSNFINANREGFVSIPGYIAIYLFSVYIGTFIKEKDSTPVYYKQFFKKMIKLFLIGIISWKVASICHDMFGVSRRLANMGYISWTLSIGCLMTVLFMGLEFLYCVKLFERPLENYETSMFEPLIFNAVNYNGLFFFLLSNISTGLVNIILQTLLLDKFISLLTLTIYMLSICSIVTILYVHQIKFKFW